MRCSGKYDKEYVSYCNKLVVVVLWVVGKGNGRIVGYAVSEIGI